jgi:Heterokaryon incompatibility protein (HET)
MTGRWTALSHCWGDPKNRPLMTTRSTLKERLKGIPMNLIPKSFVDAVLLTKVISVRYMWIDSLCIIQGDEDDWRREAKKMGMIYERAVLTFAASSSRDSLGGYFLQRRYSGFPHIFLNAPLDHPSTTKPALGEPNQVQFSFEWRTPEIVDTSVGGTPLSKRAWITQEWILSRRIVHFLTDGMKWKCGETEKSEVSTDRILREKVYWPTLVSDHSRRRLTYESDRLISLEGLAGGWSKTRRDSYLHGMFAGDFPVQLLWLPDGIKRNPSFPNAPSWSWTARLGGIWYASGILEINAESTCEIDILGANSDRLRLHSLVENIPDLAAWLPFSTYEPRIPSEGDQDYYTSIFKPTRLSDDDRGCEHLLLGPGGVRIGWASLDDGLFLDMPHLHGETLFVLLTRPKDHQHDRPWIMSYYGLLLQRSFTVEGAYKRIGIAATQDLNWTYGAEERTIDVV